MKHREVIGNVHSFMLNLTEQLSMHSVDLEKMESREKPRMRLDG